jgi:predicted transposase YbfD/YdcC
VLPLLDDIAAARSAADGPPPAAAGNDLSGLVFTADALHVHRENIQQIFNRGGDYILTVKGNMPSLERRCSPSALRTGLFPPHHVTFDRGHGRNEIRSIWAIPCVAGLDFPGVYQAFRVHRQIYDLNWNPLRKPETVHGITSLTAWQANPPTCWPATAATGEVENREHYVRDRTFDEDRSQVRTGSSPQFLAHRPQHRDEPAAAGRL